MKEIHCGSVECIKNEIIKALECCRNAERENTSEHCLKCPAAQWDILLEIETTDCIDSLLTKTLHLIKHQQAENERLEKEAKDFEECFHRMDSLYHIKCMELKVARAEAIKEFAERLKIAITVNNTNDGYLDYAVDYNCLMEDINDVVKEMIEENE